MIQFVNLLASYRLCIEEDLTEEIIIEPTAKLIEAKQNLELQVNNFIELIKKI